VRSIAIRKGDRMMDFGSKKTKSASKARDVEIQNLTGGSVRFEPTADRTSRILNLARSRNPSNSLPDKLCRFGFTLFSLLAVSGLLIWGLIFRNATLVLSFWSYLSVFIALPVLLTVYFRSVFGMASPLHRCRDPVLTLTADRVVLEMKRRALFRGRHSPSVKREFLYSRISRMEYDRASKTLRLISSSVPAATLDIVMFYDNSDAVIREIETRSGAVIHPAMRGDDYADLKDLSGLKRERDLLRPLSVSVLAFCLISILTVLAIRSYNHNNPYQPYPRTQEMYLTGTFGTGDTVTLDGCEITLHGASRAGSDARGVCYKLLFTFRNSNDSAIRFRAGEQYRGSPGNILFTAVMDDGRVIPLTKASPPPGYAGVELPSPSRLPSGRNVSVTYFIWVPDDAVSVRVSLNSDYWPPADVLRDVTYTGRHIDVNGVTVKNNETRFSIPRSVLD
jgi:hypothetical protein